MIGEKLVLRALEPEDLDTLYQWENDPEVWRISNTITPYSRFNLEQYILNTSDIFTSRQLRLMMALKDDLRTVVGAIDLYDFDPLNRRAELGILVYGGHRGKGYAMEAVELLKEYCFGTLNLHQIYCYIPTDKKINLNLFNKCGFVITGTHRHWLWSKDQWVDVHLLQLIP